MRSVRGKASPLAGFAFSPPKAAVLYFVKSKLAGYKTPKRIVQVEKMFRAPNGKTDSKSAAAYVASL